MFLMLIGSLLTVSVSAFASECDTVRHQTLRLHIVARSDDEADQALKLEVRDGILARYGDVFGSADSLASAVESAQALCGDIERTAADILRAGGCGCAVTVDVGCLYFPTRRYGEGVTLPAGHYTALRVVIGEGRGQNWWCVMYPPLCVPAASAGEAAALEARIRSLDEDARLIPKFALVELWESIRAKADG